MTIVSKRDVFLKLLAQGATYIRADATKPNVVVPSGLNSAMLMLAFGYNLPLPTDDVQASDEGITATLSFDRQPFAVTIPWNTIWMIVDEQGRGLVWEEDVPMGVKQIASGGPVSFVASPPPIPKAPKPVFTLLDGGNEGSTVENDDQPVARFELRIVR